MALINIVDERIGLISLSPANSTQAVSATTSIVPQVPVSTNGAHTGITMSPVNGSSTPQGGGGGVTFKYERHYPPGREGCPGGIVVDTIIGNPDDTNPAEPGETTIHQFIDCPPKSATASAGGFYDGSRETGFFWNDPYDPTNPNRHTDPGTSNNLIWPR